MFKELAFPSYNERDQVQAWIYTPITKPRGIVQVVHGLGEHSRRYLHMILRLNESGYVVCADDHVGHGKTAAAADTWGDYGSKGYLTTVNDEKSLHDIITGEYPGLPFVMFGHSWGSMIARSFAANYGELLTALVICGTCGVMDMGPVVAEVKALIDAGKGSERDAAYQAILFGGWTSRYEHPATPMDWISADPDIVRDHGLDPFNNRYKAPTHQANYDLADLVAHITGKAWAEQVPKELPVYNIAGDCDPVGNYGEGVYAVSNWLAETGHKRVRTQLYQGHRHEIHNDRDIRNDVIHNIIMFLLDIL
ncbi:MAG: alpha/beta hydrolase [Treponema sp.]|jgi:alpha-beta hydrolase superfamily lysophospholipase|nr:alpha/beta hydrolase [Treponema sp.]